MIKIEHTDISCWAAALRGMRNAYDSHDKADTVFANGGVPEIGENDLALATKLANAGDDHGKFLRMIIVTADITAPLYWVSEHDTYKVGTTRNSRSFMHTGVGKPFSITDFSVSDNRIYDVLSPLPRKNYSLIYPYETDEYRIYTTANGRKYKVFKNGRVFRCKFKYTDNWGSGRTREFKEKEVFPSPTASGYYELNIGGRAGEKWVLHRLVATVWIDNPNGFKTVNHINGNKGDNSVENLEWMTLEDNIRDGMANGLYENTNSLHCRYLQWKNGSAGVPQDKWGNENYELFLLCMYWENTINTLNSLRQEYIDTKDESVFQMLRQILPCGWNTSYTWQANYQVLRNIYHARKHHRLPEWHDFCHWVEGLPYAKEFIIGEEKQ